MERDRDKLREVLEGLTDPDDIENLAVILGGGTEVKAVLGFRSVLGQLRMVDDEDHGWIQMQQRHDIIDAMEQTENILLNYLVDIMIDAAKCNCEICRQRMAPYN